jgi:hypothetical protein
MPISPDQFPDYCRDAFPDIWKAVYPRHYDNLGKFHSPKEVACALASAVLSAAVTGASTNLIENTACRNQLLVACAVDKHDVPTFFVSGELLKACQQTNLPDDLTWVDIPFPHPGLVFVFERGAVPHPDGSDVPFIAMARFQTDEEVRHKAIPALKPRMGKGCLMTLTCIPDKSGDPFLYDLAMSEDSKMITDVSRAVAYDRHLEDIFAAPMAPDEEKANQALAVLGIKLLLLMNARPEQVSYGERRKIVRHTVGKNETVTKEFWTPNIIGRDYRSPAACPAESGRTVRLHWRRGHFTRQFHGPMRSLRKTIWIEPVLVGAA